MSISHRHHAAGKRKIRQRLDKAVAAPSPTPVFTAANIHYEVASKTRAVSCGSIVAIPRLVRKFGLAGAIDERLRLTFQQSRRPPSKPPYPAEMPISSRLWTP